MIAPTTEQIITAVIETLDRDIAPNVVDDDDGYTASLCRTVGQLLRALRARVEHEGPALVSDNAELRQVLSAWQPALSPAAAADVEQALSEPLVAERFPSIAALQAEACRLRAALSALITDLEDADHPARAAARAYLSHQLERERPWMADAFDGPRR